MAGRVLLRRHAWFVLALLGAALPLVLVLASGHTLEWRDTPRVHAPHRAAVVEALRAFRLPLWNPHEACGVPLFAQLVQSVLHPVSVLAAWLAPHSGLDPLIAAYVLLAAGGAALLARQLGASPAGSAAAGVAFGLSGYVLSMASVLHYLAAAGTAPWTIAALRESHRGGRWPALGAGAVACQHLAGDPQWTMVAVGLGLLLALERAWSADGAHVRGAARALAAVVFGTGLAAVQLVPAWALLGESMRGTATLTAEEKTLWALAPWRLLEFVAPGFFGGAPGQQVAPVFARLGGAAAAPGGLPTYTLPFVQSVFAGSLLLPLAAAGARAPRIGPVLAAASGLFAWLALGHHLGAAQLLGAVPIWGSFRYAEKLVGPLSLCLSLLGGLGLDRLGVRVPTRRALAAAAAAALCAGLVAIAVLSSSGDRPVRHGLGRGLLQTAAVLGLLAALWAVLRLRPGTGRIAPVALALLVYLDVLAASRFAIHAGERGVRADAPLWALKAGADPVVRVGTPLRGLSRWRPPHLDALDGILAMESRMGVTPYAASGGIDQFETYTALVPRAFAVIDTALGWPDGPRLWQYRRRFGLTHVAVREPTGPREAERVANATVHGTQVLADEQWHFSVFAVPHRPWASFAAGAVPADGEDDVLRVLRDRAGQGGWDTVVIEGPFPADFSPGRVLAAARAREQVRIEAESGGPALLVVNDAAWPGWSATIDGRPVAIQRADGLVRAVVWPAGRHVLEMRYEPVEVRLGGAISLASVVALLGWIAWQAPAARRRARQVRTAP